MCFPSPVYRTVMRLEGLGYCINPRNFIFFMEEEEGGSEALYFDGRGGRGKRSVVF